MSRDKQPQPLSIALTKERSPLLVFFPRLTLRDVWRLARAAAPGHRLATFLRKLFHWRWNLRIANAQLLTHLGWWRSGWWEYVHVAVLLPVIQSAPTVLDNCIAELTRRLDEGDPTKSREWLFEERSLLMTFKRGGHSPKDPEYERKHVEQVAKSLKLAHWELGLSRVHHWLLLESTFPAGVEIKDPAAKIAGFHGVATAVPPRWPVDVGASDKLVAWAAEVEGLPYDSAGAVGSPLDLNLDGGGRFCSDLGANAWQILGLLPEWWLKPHHRDGTLRKAELPPRQWDPIELAAELGALAWERAVNVKGD